MAIKRKDGRLIETKGEFKSIFPYIFKRKCDSVVYIEKLIDVENMLNFINELREKGHRISIFQILVIAFVRTLKERPDANRFIMGRRLYQHNDINISFMTKLEFSDEAPETSIKAKFTYDDDPENIMAKLSQEIEKAKKGTEEIRETDELIRSFLKLPRFLLRLLIYVLEKIDFYFGIPKAIYDVDPLHCSACISNLGSINTDSVYHHIYEWGNCSIFLTIGRIKMMPMCERNGKIVSKQVLDIKFSIDERITDGYYMARTLDLFVGYLSNPHLLDIKLQ